MDGWMVFKNCSKETVKKSHADNHMVMFAPRANICAPHPPTNAVVLTVTGVIKTLLWLYEN